MHFARLAILQPPADLRIINANPLSNRIPRIAVQPEIPSKILLCFLLGGALVFGEQPNSRTRSLSNVLSARSVLTRSHTHLSRQTFANLRLDALPILGVLIFHKL